MAFIIYSILSAILLLVLLYQNYKMIQNSVVRKLSFLYISNCMFILYSIARILYCLMDIAFCVDYYSFLIIDIFNYELFIIPINIFNLSICEIFLLECPQRFYLAKKKLLTMKKVAIFVLFPIIILQFICYFLDNLKYTELFLYSDYCLRYNFDLLNHNILWISNSI